MKTLKILRWTAFVMLFALATASCSKDDDDPIVDENKEQSSGSGDGNSNQKKYFTKKKFNCTKDFVDFFPSGYALVFEFETLSWNNDKEVYAKPLDGSFVYSEITNDPKSSYYGYTNDFFVWEESNFYRLGFTNYDTQTKFWTVEGNFTGEDLVNRTDEKSLYVGSFKSVSSGKMSEQSVFSAMFYNGCMGFIQKDICEQVEFSKDTAILGIACKKYVKNYPEYVSPINGQVLTPAYSESFYVLENGFCLKYKNTSEYSMTNFEVKEAKKQVANYDAVIKSFYRPKDTKSPLPTTLKDWDILTHLRTKEWFNPSPSNYVIPWENGINSMTCWSEYKKGEPFLHTYDLNIDYKEATVDALKAYIEKLKALKDFRVTTAYNDTEDPDYREKMRIGLIALYPEDTDEEREARWQKMLDSMEKTRSFSFVGDTYADHPSLTFGDSFYYIKYEINGMEMKEIKLTSFTIKISWCKVIIV